MGTSSISNIVIAQAIRIELSTIGIGTAGSSAPFDLAGGSVESVGDRADLVFVERSPTEADR